MEGSFQGNISKGNDIYTKTTNISYGPIVDGQNLAQNKIYCEKKSLVGGLNPFEKIFVKFGSFPQVRDETY